MWADTICSFDIFLLLPFLCLSLCRHGRRSYRHKNVFLF
jgi:hypothetical protein